MTDRARSYGVRLLSARDAPAAARAWNDLADGTLTPETVARIETMLAAPESDDFAAFGAEADGELCGIATARVTTHPLTGRHGEIEALMIDGRLPDDAGDTLAQHAIEWLRGHGVASISHLRDPNAPARFWERLGFRPDLLRYTLSQ
ncbi:MAG TPA: GNAT family N-acetyltransferase [Gaiellaceae bacterium]|nr:GNAT family N-acetyltransferase [Gaiellaceae bacterium]